MKRGFATGRVFRALRFTAVMPPLHTSRKACASYSRSECFIVICEQIQTATLEMLTKLWYNSDDKIKKAVLYMKHLSKIFVMLILCALTLTLIACENYQTQFSDSSTNTETEQVSDTATTIEETTEEQTTEAMTEEDSISESEEMGYLIIHRPNTRCTFRIVYDNAPNNFLNAEVNMMATMFQNYTGYQIAIGNTSKVTNREIILSSKRRPETAQMLKSLKEGEFSVRVQNGEDDGEGKLLIATTTYASAYACMEFLMENYYSDEDGLRIPYDLDFVGKEKSYSLIESTIPYLRDPCIIVENGVYYAYGTNWHCFKNTSGNLEGPWIDLGNVASLAHPNTDGGKHWAPEVHYYNGSYYMFTTYLSSVTRYKGCIILKSNSPEGPFVEITDGHITPENMDCIDGTFYVDADGQPWMIFVQEWVSAPGNVGSFLAAKLSDDLTHFISEPIELFKANEPNWTAASVTDGCWMYTTKEGELLMLWSNFDAYGYVVAVARSSNGRLDGEWIHEKNLLFSQYMTGEYEGGHAMIFTGIDGQMYLSFHSPNSTQGDRLEKPVFLAIEEKDGKLVWSDKNS